MYRRVCYISYRISGPRGAGFAEEILPRARAKNLASGVTSCLWADDKHFFQLLEGPDEAVAQTLARIAGDTRHFGPRLVSSEPVDHLVFRDEPLKLVLPAPGRTDDLDRMLLGLIESLKEDAPVISVQTAEPLALGLPAHAAGHGSPGTHPQTFSRRGPLLTNVLTRLTCVGGA
ncbi:MAG: BLUF domain-containing protein [Phycisphaerales bacterium]|nr:BLUF domain-containing protein [Phycisphaerales bacterium]